ncbi:MAG TPA: alpha/beta fold hydrolase [Candidatus Latescibacteria bacterium]|nr:alpha/beta fold hydrolase [Candidatus Latescibacterota bacterium]
MERPITFVNEGQQIVGILHVPEGRGSNPGVVLFHGCTGSKSEDHWIFVKLARRLCGEGFVVLRFDFRNSCDSEGDFEDMTVSGEISDGLRSLEWFSGLPEVDENRIGLLGLSLGGAVAACVAGRSSLVRSLVLWSPVARPKETFERLMAVKGVEMGEFPVEQGGFRFGRAFWKELPRIQPLKEIRFVKGPVLMIHGSEDRTVPPMNSEEYQEVLERYRLPCERVVIEGADHTYTGTGYESLVIEETIRWFRRTLVERRRYARP